ncbi:hypothetical protein AB4156_25690 [Cupriavidus sp. 2MCAB6]|uniref:hypothetical protein n=1 Tax=Cupriavidus sp. 2MCAB6 TaxID=3232981 RepID=UPI003F93CC98
MKIHCYEPRESRTNSPVRGAVRKLRQAVLLIRVLALCVNCVAYAQPAAPVKSVVTPEQTFMPGYLEAVSTGYDNGQALHESEGIATLRVPSTVASQLRASPAPSAPAPVAAGPSVIPVSQKTRRPQGQ